MARGIAPGRRAREGRADCEEGYADRVDALPAVPTLARGKLGPPLTSPEEREDARRQSPSDGEQTQHGACVFVRIRGIRQARDDEREEQDEQVRNPNPGGEMGPGSRSPEKDSDEDDGGNEERPDEEEENRAECASHEEGDE